MQILDKIIEQLTLIKHVRATAHHGWQSSFKTLPNGQWQELKKSWTYKKVAPGGCDCGAHKTNSEMHSNWCSGISGTSGTTNAKFQQSNAHLTSLFDKYNDHVKAGNEKQAGVVKGQIKNYALAAPKGSIDLGHLGKLRENRERLKDPSGPNDFSQGDFGEIVGHHAEDVKDLKDLHDNHGGIDAVEHVLRTMGANGQPIHYTGMKFKNPEIQYDLVHLMNPGKDHMWRNDPDVQAAGGVSSVSKYNDSWDGDSAVQKEVDDTWWQSTADPDKHLKAHENAVIKRGLRAFKKYHGL